jgi:DNA-binding response OmpR family regulator
LCVDDHADTRTLLAYMLSTAGYRVVVAGTVAEALTLAGRMSYDLFMLDVRLPDGSGIELCKQLSKASSV